MNKITFELGGTIDANERVKNIAEPIFESIHTSQAIMWEAGKQLKHLNKSLWECIREIYPALELFECHYDFKKNQIVIVGHRKPPYSALEGDNELG